MRRTVTATLVALAAMTLALAAPASAGDPIKSRREIMKTNGFAAKTAGAMLKGQRPFDAHEAELAMRAINAAAYALVRFFPKGSETGGDTAASPKIWQNMKEFLHIADELEEHAEKAIEAARKGEAAFKPAFLEVVKYCKECHEKFRIKKDKKK